MTPTPPPFGEIVALGSGAGLLLERSFTAGDLFIGLAVVGLGLLGLLIWAYGWAQGQAGV